jgi:hypothetical protein
MIRRSQEQIKSRTQVQELVEVVKVSLSKPLSMV